MFLKFDCIYKSPEDAHSDSIGLEWDQKLCSQVMLMLQVPAAKKHEELKNIRGGRILKRKKERER